MIRLKQIMKCFFQIRMFLRWFKNLFVLGFTGFLGIVGVAGFVIMQSIDSLTNLELGVRSYEIEDYKDAWAKLTPLAEEGNTEAQLYLGFMYDDGLGVVRDDAEAVKWYRSAAKAGHAEARYNLGWMYDYGEGVEQDYREAIKWYRRAAEAKHARAQNNLGWMYDKARGVKQDYRRAYMWYVLAQEQGDERASRNRDRVVKNMTPAQLTEAQEMSVRCREQNYKNCDQLAPQN